MEKVTALAGDWFGRFLMPATQPTS